VIKDNSPQWRHRDSLTRAVSILEEQFADDPQVPEKIAQGHPPFSSVVFALACLDPRHPEVRDTYNAIKQGYEVTAYFSTVYACVSPQEFLGWLSHDLDQNVDDYNYNVLVGAVVRRLKRDLVVRSLVQEQLVQPGIAKPVQVNLIRLLNAAGFVSPEIIQFCVTDANAQLATGMVECALDVVTGNIRGLPLPLLDVALATAG
jgi:hypothetical protein